MKIEVQILSGGIVQLHQRSIALLRKKTTQLLANKILNPKLPAAFVLAGLFLQTANAQFNFTTLDDPLAVGVGPTSASGISGTNIVGSYTDRNGNSHGFLYNGSAYSTLDDPLAGQGLNEGTYASDISGANTVGFYTDSNDNSHGFLYDGGAYTTLDDPLGTNGTFALGNSGASIVGYYTDSNGNSHGFLYDGSAYTTLDDPLGTNSTVAYCISGVNVVGSYEDSNGNSHGFLYNGSAYTTLDDPLGTNGTLAYGNDGTSIVGAYIDSNGNSHGFLYNGSTYTTLDDPLAGQGLNENTYAADISGANIVGSYTDSNGNTHGFVATPALPILTMVQTDANVILTWPTNVAGFILQSTTNLVLPVNWNTVSNAPIVVNGQNTVTNPISGAQMFYRLSE